MQYVLPSEDGVAHESPQEILEETLSPRDDRRVFLGLRLALDGVVGETLLGRDGRDDEHGVQARERLMKREEGGVSSSHGT